MGFRGPEVQILSSRPEKSRRYSLFGVAPFSLLLPACYLFPLFLSWSACVLRGSHARSKGLCDNAGRSFAGGMAVASFSERSSLSGGIFSSSSLPPLKKHTKIVLRPALAHKNFWVLPGHPVHATARDPKRCGIFLEKLDGKEEIPRWMRWKALASG